MDLTVRVTDLTPTPGAMPIKAGAPLWICDRCHDVDEIVVAVMEILPLEERWALCGPCKQELPEGFYLA